MGSPNAIHNFRNEVTQNPALAVSTNLYDCRMAPDDFKLEEYIPAIREGKIMVSILKSSLKENLNSPQHGKMYAMKAIDSFLNPRINNDDDEDTEDEEEETHPPKKSKK